MTQTPLIRELVARLYTRAALDRLPSHLEERYGIEGARAARLDGGVFRIERDDGPPWVARVFPAARPREAVEGDAEVLRILEKQGFPAERLAQPDPVSLLDGQGVLLTEYVDGAKTGTDEASLREMGRLLGRLQELQPPDGPAMRDAGSLHHWSVRGGLPRFDIEAGLSWLEAVATTVALGEQGDLARVREALAGLDDLGGLPRAFVHPDFQPENIIRTPENNLSVIDWADSGIGPRIVSLAILLNFGVRSSSGLEGVDAVISGYRESITLTPEEIDLLPDALRRPPLLLDCFVFCLGRKALPDVVAGLEATARRSEAIARRVRRVYAR